MRDSELEVITFELSTKNFTTQTDSDVWERVETWGSSHRSG